MFSIFSKRKRSFEECVFSFILTKINDGIFLFTLSYPLFTKCHIFTKTPPLFLRVISFVGGPFLNHLLSTYILSDFLASKCQSLRKYLLKICEWKFKAGYKSKIYRCYFLISFKINFCSETYEIGRYYYSGIIQLKDIF